MKWSRRRAVHGRRFRLLVRGHLPEQGHRADADRRHVASTASPAGSSRSTRPPCSSSSTTPTSCSIDMLAGDTLIGGGQSVRQSQRLHLRRLRAGALPEAVPAEIFLRGRGQRARQGGRLRQLGASCCTSRRTGTLNPELPTLGPWQTTRPDQHADLGDGAQSLLLRGRHGRQPAALHRPRRHDAGARTLEVVNLRAMAGEYDLQERHIDLGKLPVILENRERGNYDVHLDLALQRRGHHSPRQPELHGRSRDRQVAAPTPISAARCRSASTATRSTRRSGSASARRARPCRREVMP